MFLYWPNTFYCSPLNISHYINLKQGSLNFEFAYPNLITFSHQRQLRSHQTLMSCRFLFFLNPTPPASFLYLLSYNSFSVPATRFFPFHVSFQGSSPWRLF